MRRRILLGGDNYESVDLGLSVKWAKCNVGAETETDYGNYYQYGKGSAQYSVTSGQSYYTGTENPLASTADTATVVMGSGWHMPTVPQFYQLTANTTYSWTSINGVRGGKFTASNGNYVFFPAAGCYVSGRLVGVESYSCIWSCSPYGGDIAYFFRSYGGGRGMDRDSRNIGFSVRGVCS